VKATSGAPKLSPLRMRAECGSCEFASLTQNSDFLLFCRRRAPVLVNSGGGAVFPVVNSTDWCGDYREELDA
jgi:hypothetical protein